MFKKVLSTLLAVSLLHAASSFGLADSSAPTKIQIPFANSAGGAYVRTVPVASQIGIQNGAASYTDGFPPLNFTPISAGGVPPFGQDMNGILRDVSAHARWWAAGGPVYYDSTYQTAIGGYPKGAIVQSAVTTGLLWASTTENNVTNPDTGGAGWVHPNNTFYAPLTGTGASGTWGINISGVAATATSATTAGTSGSFTITATGFTTTITATAKWYLNNGVVHLYIPDSSIQGTSNATTFILTGLPVAIRPATIHSLSMIQASDNSLQTTAKAFITSGGTIGLNRIDSSGAAQVWTSSGTKALYSSDFAWTLD